MLINTQQRIHLLLTTSVNGVNSNINLIFLLSNTISIVQSYLDHGINVLMGLYELLNHIAEQVFERM